MQLPAGNDSNLAPFRRYGFLKAGKNISRTPVVAEDERNRASTENKMFSLFLCFSLEMSFSRENWRRIDPVYVLHEFVRSKDLI